VTIYSDGYTDRMLFVNNITNAIIDNINIDGMGYGNGDTHGANFAGIQLATASDNNTVSNSKLFNNQFGIKVE